MRLLTVTMAVVLSFAPCASPAPAQVVPNPGTAATPSSQASPAIRITRNGSRRISKAPSEHFTGSVNIEPLFDVHDPSRVVGASVTFEAGARTIWHSHPLGQTLIVTAGVGWIQQWGGPIQEMREGDVVWIPPGTKHWHGATPGSSMTHIAITEQLEGKTVTWMERVSDEQYRTR